MTQAHNQPYDKSAASEYHPILGLRLRRLWNRWHLPVSHRRYRAVSQEADDAWVALADAHRQLRRLGHEPSDRITRL